MAKVRTIRKEEFDECLDALCQAFPHAGREHFAAYFHGDPWFKPDYTRVCEEDGRIVSSVQIVRRAVRVGKSRLVMGGIANVGTPPEHRGKGYSTECLKSSIEIMEGEDFDFSLLYTGINPFYEKLGWVTVPIDFVVGDLRNPMPTVDDEYVVREYHPEDARSLIDIYNTFNEDIVLTQERNVDYWNGYCMVEPERIKVAETRDGSIVGYAITGGYRDITGIIEAGYLPGHEGCIIGLFAELGQKMLESGKTTGGAMLPDVPAMKSGLDAILSNQRTEVLNSAMFRVINLERMIERMLPEFSERAAESGVSGSVELAVVDTLSQIQFFQLLFGMKEPQDIVPDATPLIKALFPKRPNIYWLADHF